MTFRGCPDFTSLVSPRKPLGVPTPTNSTVHPPGALRFCVCDFYHSHHTPYVWECAGSSMRHRAIPSSTSSSNRWWPKQTSMTLSAASAHTLAGLSWPRNATANWIEIGCQWLGMPHMTSGSDESSGLGCPTARPFVRPVSSQPSTLRPRSRRPRKPLQPRSSLPATSPLPQGPAVLRPLPPSRPNPPPHLHRGQGPRRHLRLLRLPRTPTRRLRPATPTCRHHRAHHRRPLRHDQPDHQLSRPAPHRL
jgi:hypothetical protein